MQCVAYSPQEVSRKKWLLPRFPHTTTLLGAIHHCHLYFWIYGPTRSIFQVDQSPLWYIENIKHEKHEHEKSWKKTWNPALKLCILHICKHQLAHHWWHNPFWQVLKASGTTVERMKQLTLFKDWNVKKTLSARTKFSHDSILV